MENAPADDFLVRIAECVERGKADSGSPFPPAMRGQIGVDEWTARALASGADPQRVLVEGLVAGMGRIGVRFRANEVFVPEVLMAAKAMNAGLKHLRPLFRTGEVKRKGTLVIGTVAGDLHDIGKNLAAMIIEGAGWGIVDLGVDVPAAKFLAALEAHPGAAVGLSALLTTTMINMEESVRAIKASFPSAPVLVGGAPLTPEFATRIGADCCAPDPQAAVEFLERARA